MPENLKTNPKNKKSSLEGWAKYSGLAFQMGAVIFVGVLFANKVNKSSETGRPLLAVIIILFSVFAAIYLAIKDFVNFNKK